MALVNKVSKFDLAKGNSNPVSNTPDKDGTEWFRDGGNRNSPFNSKEKIDPTITPGGQDHLVSLLQNKVVTSTNNPNGGPYTQPIYNPETANLSGGDNGNGCFHDIASPTALQGKQLKGKDLHEALLENAYKYQHGNSSVKILGGTPGGGKHDINGGDGPYFANFKNKAAGIGPEPTQDIALTGVSGQHLDTIAEQSLNSDFSKTRGKSPWSTTLKSDAAMLDLDGGFPGHAEYMNGKGPSDGRY